ncbi:MAG: LysM peptidoglycan-binding domain-containing protein [Bacteroidaceae bacterium]|nr:LysM peptidoglycan-binding domain-containing protein [Bacteroidaceae bacterium]
MKLYKYITLLLFAITIVLPTHSQNEKYFIHTVSKGQTLYSISRMYEVTVNDIVALNPECAEKLAIGYKLKIRQKANDTTAASSTLGENKKYHTIQSGETLYRLSKMYNVTPQNICAANPGLSINNFRTGEVILIPAPTVPAEPIIEEEPKEEKPKSESNIRTTHKVERGETLYSLARRYGITEEELLAANPQIKKKKLKRKSIINIPFSAREIAEKAAQEQKKVEKEQSNAEIFRQIEEEEQKNMNIADGVKVAVVLPFMLDTYSPTEQSRMIEYYEGFLMAVERLKQYGYSFHINTFDSGKEQNSLTPLLNSGKLDEMDIIFGALYPKHNKELATYAQKKNIPLVIPFTSKEDEIFRNPMVYVVNTMQSYFFSEVTDHFTQMFPNANIIFINSDNGNNKKEFVATLKKALEKGQTSYTTIGMDLFAGQEPNYTSIKAVMKSDKKNIFIPTSGSETTLSTLLASMMVMKNDTINELPQFTLFGYPEWQIYARNMQDKMYEVDTYFYTSFFSHASFPETVRFQNNYIQWYSHTYQNIYPRYSMLGYDTGYFFLLAISKFGKNMPDNIRKISFTPIQTGFKFERVNNWGGFVNKKIYFVRYTPEYKVEKIDFDK